MKRFIIASSAVLGLLLLTIGCGGFRYYSYCRYVPTSPATISSESNFQLSIHPVFVGGGSSGLKTVLPLLYYEQWEPTETPQIIVETKPLSDYGYGGKTRLILESVDVENEFGEIINLVYPLNARAYALHESRINYEMHSLGTVYGSGLCITVSGHVFDARGNKIKFNQSQTWKVMRSNRFGLGIHFSE